MFVEKSQEEIDNMTPKEFEAYLVAKREHEASVRKTEITEAINALKQENAEANKELIAKHESEIALLKTNLDEFALRMKSITEKGVFGKVSKFDEEFTANKSAIIEVAKGGKGEVEFKALTNRASIDGNQQATELATIGQLATRKLALYDLFPKVTLGTNNNGTVRYYDWDEATTVRAAAMVAEGIAFPESTAKFKTYTLSLQKVGDTLPVTEELFEDAQMFYQELKLFLDTNVALVVDTQLNNGDGTSTNLKGLTASSTAYVPVAAGISDASIYDLIVKMSEKITATGGAKYMPDFAVMNITDINKMRLKKDANENYIIPPFVSREGNQVAGVLVIESNAITANTMVVGDSRFARIYEKGGIVMSEGMTGTQFTEDEWTLKARKRLLFLIRTADKGGFMYSDNITADLVTLAT